MGQQKKERKVQYHGVASQHMKPFRTEKGFARWYQQDITVSLYADGN
jgi:hypothetical protein